MKSKRFHAQGQAGWLVALVLSSAWCWAGEPPVPATNAAKMAEPPPTHTVARAPAKSKAQFEAVFEAVEMKPVKLEPKSWTDLTVLEALPHGARVKQGERLVKLDLEKLKDQIEELELDRPAGALALELAEAELENLRQTTPLKLEAAKRSQRIADEDLAHFERIGRTQREKGARFNLKGAEQRLDGAKEELKQLEKMYKADDVVEDTEEIILRRSKFAVESAEFGLETSKEATEQSLKTGIPREHESLKAARQDQEQALALAGETLPRNLSKKRLDVEKLKRDQKKADKRFADLKKDLQTLGSVVAPMDGLVYYGACEGGRWTTGATVAKKLVPSGKLTINEVFITVVNPDKLVLKAVVQESDLGTLKPGVEGTASPVSAPDQKLPAKLEEISAIPLPGGGFEARLWVQTGDKVRVMPGMTCKVSLGEPAKAGPLQAPKEAVFTDGNQSHVYVLKSDGQPEKRQVKPGETDGKMAEILEGLSEGEKILLSKPKPAWLIDSSGPNG